MAAGGDYAAHGHLPVGDVAYPFLLHPGPAMLHVLSEQRRCVEVVALLALESLAPFDKGLILGLLCGPVLHLRAAPLRLVDGVRESLIRPEQLSDLHGGRVLRRIQRLKDLLQQPDVLLHIGRDGGETLTLLVD